MIELDRKVNKICRSRKRKERKEKQKLLEFKRRRKRKGTISKDLMNI